MKRKLLLSLVISFCIPTLLVGKPKNKIFRNVAVLNLLKAWLISADCGGFRRIEAFSAKVSDEIEINKITKGGATVSWPSTVGAAGTHLASDGKGNLFYDTPLSGGGNVSTKNLFGNSTALLTTDLANGSNYIKETTVTLNGSNDIAGVNELTANTVNADLNGNASSATNFSGPLVGDVTGNQNSTVVSFVGGQTATQVADATVAANAATSTNTPGAIVRRHSVTGDFSAGTITAQLTGNVTGNLTGNADTATSATTATNFTGPLTGDVIGTQGATVVTTVGGQTAANVASGTALANSATSSNVLGAIVRRHAVTGNFSATTVTANLTGNVTGNLTGNADTATNATNATTAVNFSGALLGDVVGNQTTTTVALVGGKTAAAVALATASVEDATENDTINRIVKRDGSGDFSTNMITINGTVSNPKDATTKQYVDAVASAGLVPKEPAAVVSTSDVSLTGTQTIDGVVLDVDDRVLLVGQTNQIENGLWEVELAAWERPTDFATGDAAGQAYVLILEGSINAGSSWLCETPLSLIDTDTIIFDQFSLPGQTTGANVGTGDGKVFRDKTGVTLNFKSIAAGTHMVVTNNADDILLETDAVSDAATPNTIVSRNGSGNMIGAASLNVLKTGDTMSGNLNLATQSEVRFEDSAGGEYVGLRAPSAVGSSYTVDLPGSSPSAGQYLQASSASATQWSSIGGSPEAARTFYVSKAGSDSNDGSILAPFLTVKHGVEQADLIATSTNPVSVNVGPGIFVEDNSGGPILITSDGISIEGASLASTTIMTATVSNDLFSVTTPNIEFKDLTLESGGGSISSAISMNVSSTGRTRFDSISLLSFYIGLDFSSSSVVPPLAFINNLQCSENETSIAISDFLVILEGSVLRGTSPISPAKTAITATGTDARLYLLSTVFVYFDTGISIGGGANANLIGSDFETVQNGIIVSGGAKVQLISSNFILNNATTTNVFVTGASSKIYVEGCLFDCEGAADTPQGTALKVTDAGTIIAGSSTIEEAAVAIQCGEGGDTSTTKLVASGVNLVDCTMDIVQNGQSTLHFISGRFDSTKMSFNDTTNVVGGSFDTNGIPILTMGKLSDVSTKVYQVGVVPTNMPFMGYEPDYYSHKGVIYQEQNANSACMGVQAASENAGSYVITGDRTKEAGVNLISDAGNLGNPDNVRGWSVVKTGTDADLKFEYSNTDISGQALRGSNSVMVLDGFNNQVEFPEATNDTLPTNTVAKLVWAGDTNLYRHDANILGTDGDVVIEGITADRVVATDTSKKLIATATSPTELGYLSGVTSPIQTQIDGKVAKAGDTMTGPLQVPSGDATNPTIKFTGSTNTGLFAAVANELSLGTNGAERIKITDDDMQVLVQLIITKVLCDQSIQAVTATDGGSVTVNANVSILLVNATENIVPAYTVTFPPNPINGQKFTILIRFTGNFNLNLNNVGGTGGASVENEVSQLNPLDNLLDNQGGTSVTYIYYQTDNAWYRCGRG